MESGIIYAALIMKIITVRCYLTWDLKQKSTIPKDTVYRNCLIRYTMAEIKGVDDYENLKYLF